MLTRYKNLSLSLIFSSIVLLNTISNSPLLFDQYRSIPQFFTNKVDNIINQDKVLGIGAYRWSNIDNQPMVVYTSKIYYNKATLIFSEFWDFVDFFSPRFYFLAGDGSPLTSANTEPLLSILFPFWILGIASLIKHNRYKIFIFIFANCFVAYLIGQKNLIFLWPTLLAYAYISVIGLQSIKSKLLKNTSLIAICSYWLFIAIRIINIK